MGDITDPWASQAPGPGAPPSPMGGSDVVDPWASKPQGPAMPQMPTMESTAGKALGGMGGGLLAKEQAANQKNFDLIFGHATESLKASPSVMAPASKPGAPPQLQMSGISPPPMVAPPPMVSDARAKTRVSSGARDLRAFLEALRRTNADV